MTGMAVPFATSWDRSSQRIRSAITLGPSHSRARRQSSIGLGATSATPGTRYALVSHPEKARHAGGTGAHDGNGAAFQLDFRYVGQQVLDGRTIHRTAILVSHGLAHPGAGAAEVLPSEQIPGVPHPVAPQR